MRLRNIPGADEIVSNSIYCVQDPRRYRGEWFRFLGNERQIHIEIGMGKGQFLLELAQENPDINYIGIERYTSVLLRAVQKMEENPVTNLHFLCIDASTLPEIFEKGEVDRIYLNFSDPWPKDRHARRRLTSSDYLARYAHILAEDGQIEFKTDNQDLFTFSLGEIEASDIWKLDASTRDLHKDKVLSEGNIMTEYEQKFSGMGHPICKLIASYQDGAWDMLPPLPDISRQPNPWGDGVDSSTNCLQICAWFDQTVEDQTYSFVIRLEHKGHQSYGQSFSLYFDTSVQIVELPGDVTGHTDGNALHLTRHNELNDNGLTEIWIKLSASEIPNLDGIGNIHCQ